MSYPENFAAWLDSRDFYEVCQQYRWSELPFKNCAQEPKAADTFEALKHYIRLQVSMQMDDCCNSHIHTPHPPAPHDPASKRRAA